MLKQGYNRTKIGVVLGKSKSVSSREIHRNKNLRSGEYQPDPAQKKYRQREDEKKKHIRFTDSIKSDVQPLIEEDYSPEQIVGTLEKRGVATVSHERIYQHIRVDKKQKGLLHTHLRRQGRHDRKRGSRKDLREIIRDRVSIDQRPRLVETRERFGDLEVDLIIWEHHKETIVTNKQPRGKPTRYLMRKLHLLVELKVSSLIFVKISKPFLDSPPKAPKATEIDNPTKLESEIPIPITFLKTFSLTFISTLSGTAFNVSLALAAAKAIDADSVQPAAGTNSFFNSL